MKKILVLPLLVTSLLMVGCGGKNDPSVDPTDIEPTPTDRKKNQVVSFYIDYWHSDEPFYQMEWYSNEPLGECPAPCKLTSSNATDPLFPVFLGWSQYSSSIDDSHLWNFKEDAKGGVELNLYGIWVAEN